jgi:hypothetical protein
MKVEDLELDKVYLYDMIIIDYGSTTEIVKNLRLKFLGASPAQFEINGVRTQEVLYLFKWIDWRCKVKGGKTLNMPEATVVQRIIGPEEPGNLVNNIEDLYV